MFGKKDQPHTMFKKANANAMITAFVTVLLFGVLIVGSTIMASVVGNIQSTQTANSAPANISANGLSAFLTMSTLFSPVGLVIIAALIIAVLFGAIVYVVAGGMRK